MGSREANCKECRLQLRGKFLVIVHPGSACGSADFNYGGFAVAEVRRQALIREWRNWQGGVIVIDSELSDELPRYPQFRTALDGLLTRTGSSALLAIRIRVDDPIEDRVIATALRRWKFSRNDAHFIVGGAWRYAGEQGCVGGVWRAIRKLGYRAMISPAALTDYPSCEGGASR